MTKVARPPTFNDRTLNRLLLALVAILAVGGVAFAVFYVTDRNRPTGPTLVERQTTQFEEAIRKDPQNLNVRLQLAGAYTVAQRYDDALEQYNTVLKAKPQFKSALLGRGETLKLKGDTAGAAKDFQAVIDLAKDGEFAAEDNELARAYYWLGDLRLAQGKAKDAVDLLLASLAITRTDADALNRIGAAFLETGETAKSIEALRAAVMFVPTGWAEPYQTLSKTYAAAKQPEEAAWATAMAALAERRIDEAIAGLKPLTKGPASTDAKIGLGLAMEATGDVPAAADWYRQALIDRPDDFSAQAGLARSTSSKNPHASPALPSAPTTGGS